MPTRFTWKNIGNKYVDELGHQLQKIVRAANRGGIETRYTYIESMVKFTKWVQPAFHMKKFANLQDKHLIAFAKYEKDNGKVDKYVKNELSALRYLHSITPNTRHELENSEKVNRAAGLGSTPNHHAKFINQAWTRSEIDKFSYNAIQHGHPELASMMQITAVVGTRIDEIATLRRNQVENALRTGQLHLTNTKGGRPRDVPLNYAARSLLSDAIRDVPRGEYVFVPHDTPVHLFKGRIQDYIDRHRNEVQDPTRVGDPHRTELHFHGIRHYFAQQQYREYREQGMNDHEAREKLMEILGHGRMEITYVYVP